ncbi:MAG: hypothetical protein E7011_02190 [Alphaproteobacteria bacterium]|nr:hypothetical protein [Alphaproteobacteria bacterium]
MTNTVQNAPTKLETNLENNQICRDATTNVFDRLIKWLPLREVAEQAAANLIARMDTADFFTEKYALTEKQKEYIRQNIASIMREAGDQVVAKHTEWDKENKEFIGNTIVEEMIKIPEQTMAALGRVANRGAVLAMTAIKANAGSDKADEITMRKSKETGDITIPTRGVFISTNCIESIKEQINIINKDIDIEVK